MPKKTPKPALFSLFQAFLSENVKIDLRNGAVLEGKFEEIGPEMTIFLTSVSIFYPKNGNSGEKMRNFSEFAVRFSEISSLEAPKKFDFREKADEIVGKNRKRYGNQLKILEKWAE
eukprot:TRINITY_DN941_c0_g2_i1.p2 TRINITY_DN941_c0_g2~~TRINITY_DN941_c0_g2_i1.p2  ORF type:complete len:116 (-),score=23.14 TRINITY_DN941_c0_g2_i1:191-538(-)